MIFAVNLTLAAFFKRTIRDVRYSDFHFNVYRVRFVRTAVSAGLLCLAVLRRYVSEYFCQLFLFLSQSSIIWHWPTIQEQ